MLPMSAQQLAAQSRPGGRNWRCHCPAARDLQDRSRNPERSGAPRPPWRAGPGPPRPLRGPRTRGGGGGAVTAPQRRRAGPERWLGGCDGRVAVVGPAAGRQLGGRLVRGQLHHRSRHRRVLQHGAWRRRRCQAGRERRRLGTGGLRMGGRACGGGQVPQQRWRLLLPTSCISCEVFLGL